MNRQDRWIILALCAALAVLGHKALGQAPTPPAPNKVYLRHQTFCLPIGLNELDRTTLQEIQLYVRHLPEGAWTCKETAPPNTTEFKYHAVEDGEYWFTIATLERGGKITPAEMSRMTPQLIVVVDTQPPEVTLSSQVSADKDALVECKVQDANLDPSRVHVEYQVGDKTWRVMESLPGKPTLFHIPGPLGTETVVRATASDRAGNKTTRLLKLAPPAVAANTIQELTALIGPEGSPPSKTSVPAAELSLPPAGTDRGTDAPRSPGQTVSPPRQLVNGKHITLDYQIEQQGPSGISKVEVWITRDGGANWQRLCDDPDRRSPVEFDLPGEGVYGISLVMTNGNGLGGMPPAKGDLPDSVIEVDLTRPVAQLVTVRPGSGDDAGTLLFNWIASDKNLGPTPIDLYYATQQGGPWLPIAKGVRNDGSYRWPVPRDAGAEFFIRMEVADQAGNVARCEMSQPVVVDLVRPKARVLNITVGAPRPTSPPGN